MSNEKLSIHISDVKAFKSCRRRFWFSSMLGLGLEPNEPYPPFFTGRIIHTALEDYYTQGLSLMDATVRAVTVETERAEVAGTDWYDHSEMFDEQTQLIYGMMEHYEQWVNGKRHAMMPFGDHNLEFIEMEANFNVPFYTDSGRVSPKISLGGRFDGIVRRKDDGSLWLWETKTARSIPELARTLDNDEQAGAYIYAAEVLTGKRVQGVVYNVLRKKIPTRPRKLLDGSLSQAKNIDTTFEAYVAEIKDNHPSYSNEEIMQMYGEMLQHLQTENRFFERIAIRRTEHEINQLADELHHVGLEMLRKNTRMYPTPSWATCNFCRFKSPCLQMNANADWQGTLDALYRPRKDRVLRPYFIAGFQFSPLGDGYYLVWYKDELVTEDYVPLKGAIVSAYIFIQEQQETGWEGPSEGDFVRAVGESSITNVEEVLDVLTKM